MIEQEAHQKGERARAAGRLVELWLEHPWVAHDMHEQAASAYEQLVDDGTKRFERLASEHRAAARHFAFLEANWNKLMGYNQRDAPKAQSETS